MDQRIAAFKVIFRSFIPLLLASGFGCDKSPDAFSLAPKITKDEYMRVGELSYSVSDYILTKERHRILTRTQIKDLIFYELLIRAAIKDKKNTSLSIPESKALSLALIKEKDAPLQGRWLDVFSAPNDPKSTAALRSWLNEFSKTIPIQKNAAF